LGILKRNTQTFKDYGEKKFLLFSKLSENVKFFRVGLVGSNTGILLKLALKKTTLVLKRQNFFL